MPEIKTKYNDTDTITVRKDQEDPWVVYLIVRSSLAMSPGKIAAQCGHAIGMLYGYFDSLDNQYLEHFNRQEMLDFWNWKNDSFRKIVLKAKDNDWDKILNEIKCLVVRDAGLTEVDPGSETVICTLPIKKSDRPNIIKRLKIL